MPDFGKIGPRLGAATAPAAPPLPGLEADGRFAVEHQQLFASVFNGGIGTYYTRFDEALRSSYEDAIAMRNDASIFELIRHRQYPVLNVQHHLKPDNPRDKNQVEFCARLLRILDATVDMEDLRLANLEAIFWGKAGAQLALGRKWVDGAQRVVVCDHEPVHGDKIVHRFDGTPGVMIRTTAEPGILARGGETFRSDRALCLALRDSTWRSRFTLHKHEPSDAEFLFEADKAGAKFGLGLRDRIYWVWWLRQEVLSWAMDALKRIGSNGNLLGFYPQGNAAAKVETLDALKAICDHNVAAFPVGVGQPSPGSWFQSIPPSAIAYDVMLSFLNYLDGIIRRAIVGQELTGQGQSLGLGSGQAEVQEGVLQGINAYDSKKLAGCLTRDLLPTLIRENFGAVPFGVQLTFEREQDELEAKLRLYKAFVDLGATVDLSEPAAEAGVRLVRAGTPGASEPPAASEPGGPGDGPPPAPAPEKMSRAVEAERYAAGAGSACVVVPVPPAAAARLAVPGGLPAGDLHVTLAYLGRDLPADRLPALRTAVRAAAARSEALAGTLAGSGTFPPGPASAGKSVLWSAVDVPGLAELRHAVVEALEAAGFAVDRAHGWTPHVTLAYPEPGNAIRRPAGLGVLVEFDRLGLWVGPDRVEVPLRRDGIRGPEKLRREADPERYGLLGKLFGGQGKDQGGGQHHAGAGGETVDGKEYTGGEFTPGNGGGAASAPPEPEAKPQPEPEPEPQPEAQAEPEPQPEPRDWSDDLERGDATLAEAYRPWMLGMTDGERGLVSDYTNDLYVKINDYQRDRAAGKVAPDPAVEKKIARLEKALVKGRLPEPTVAFRGISGHALRQLGLGDGTALEPGATVEIAGFKSTSIDRTLAAGYAGGAAGAVLAFRLPAGTPGGYANAGGLSFHPAERELVLPQALSRFRVVSARRVERTRAHEPGSEIVLEPLADDKVA